MRSRTFSNTRLATCRARGRHGSQSWLRRLRTLAPGAPLGLVIPTATAEPVLGAVANSAAWTFSLAGIGVGLLFLLGVRVGVLRRRLAACERRLGAECAARAAAERRLAADDKLLRTIIETEPECVKLQAADGTVLDMNPAGLSLIDADCREQMVGHSVYSVIAPEYHGAYRELTERVFLGQAQTLEFEVVSFHNQRRWLETHAVPLRDARGNVVSLLGITRDITGRKQAEEAARQHQRQLEHVTRLSTMGEMASALAHEINQPLCAVATYAQACLRLREQATEEAEAEIAANLAEISLQAQRAGEIIRRMRDFVRKRDPKRETVDVNAIVREVLRFVGPEARRCGVSIEADFATHALWVRADHIQIEQVLLNLLRNGIDAMRDCAPGERVLRLRSELSERGEVRISVRDSGAGVAAEVGSDLFEPFVTTKPEGMGLGLSIARSIVERHGGSMWLGPSEGRGATFQFSLPSRAIPHARAG